MDWAKITGYFGLLCIIIAALAQAIAAVAPNFLCLKQPEVILRWSIYLWNYAAVVTGIYLKQKTGKYYEILIGLSAGLICLVPWLTLPAAVVYFFRAFAKLSKMNGLPF